MVPLYAARIEDLGPGDFVKVDCAACDHTALLAPAFFRRAADRGILRLSLGEIRGSRRSGLPPGGMTLLLVKKADLWEHSSIESAPRRPRYLKSVVRRNDMTFEGVFFLPWIGTQYEYQEKRVLLLGESHHGDDPSTWATAPERATIECTQAYIEGAWRHKYWTNIIKVVEGRDYWEIDAKSFWSKVALYNYIQEIVGDGPGIAPTEAMWRNAEVGFRSVLRYLEPTHMLVLAKRLWDRLPAEIYSDRLPIVAGDHVREARIFSAGAGGRTIGTWLPHPSYHFHFNAKQLHPVVRALIAIQTENGQHQP